MLKQLHIENFILIEEAQISFESGFSVFSGETGSGKSAILHALRQVMGEKADSALVRHGATKGVVEAIFDLSCQPKIKELLSSSGIDLEEGSELLIRREITAQGKSRSWINHQLAQVSLLKQLGSYLIQIVGQNSSSILLSAQEHRALLDRYGEIEGSLSLFKSHWEGLQKLEKELTALKISEGERMRLLEIGKMELSEIEEAAIKTHEEEELFLEHNLLIHAEERRALSDELLTAMQTSLPRLSKMAIAAEKLDALDSSHSPFAAGVKNAFVELQELSYELQRYSGGIDANPQKLDALDERLRLFSRLKKKYGGTPEAVLDYAQKTLEKIAQLENADLAIEELEKKVSEEKLLTDRAAMEISSLRHEAAQKLSEQIEKEFAALNMPQAKLCIAITAQMRGNCGDDYIEFFLLPNIGERKSSLCDGASGGERSRVLLSLYVLLAGKNSIPTLIFDEIDANIGGLTAATIGEKLLFLAENHQIICITHFPQVAEQAEHHMSVVKKEMSGRTFSSVERLDIAKRCHELSRMRGERL
jgi:DNA repair protein RecN (Recombination protein N)